MKGNYVAKTEKIGENIIQSIENKRKPYTKESRTITPSNN
jgi:hypothetical protein